jgi:SHS2 domain-containing protein
MNNIATPRWEHFDHDADIGIRGIAPTLAQSFEQAALALIAVITDPDTIKRTRSLSLSCSAVDPDILFFDWINELIFQMTTQDLLFGHFEVEINKELLTATAFGEPVNREKHQPAVEIKGATFTELRVYQNADAMWVAQCVVDV